MNSKFEDLVNTHIIKEHSKIMNKGKFLMNHKLGIHSKRYFQTITFISTKKDLATKMMNLIGFLIFFISLMYLDESTIYKKRKKKEITNFYLIIISILTFFYAFLKVISKMIKFYLLKIEGLRSFDAQTFNPSTICFLLLYIIHPNLLTSKISIYMKWKVPYETYITPLNFFLIAFQNSLILYEISKRIIITRSLFSESSLYLIRNAKVNKTAVFFYIKYLFKKNPFRLLIWSLFFIGIQLSMLLKIFESPLGFLDSHSLSYWSNCFWTTFMIMLTTGYGDCFPQTYFGKLISVLSGISGYLVFSLIIISFSNFIGFKNREHKLYTLLEKNVLKSQLENSAATIISRVFQSYIAYKKNDFAKYRKYKVRLENEILYYKSFKKNYKQKKLLKNFNLKRQSTLNI